MDDQEYLKDILTKLSTIMPYKWRVQSFSKFKPQATCVAYIDARDLMDRLDSVCFLGWERDHKEIKGHIYSGVGVMMPSGRVIWRWDCGTESNTEAEKGESSDSFKRAGVNWGVGRFLYDLKIQYVDALEKKTGSNNPYVVDSKGKRVWDLTTFINDKTYVDKSKALVKETYPGSEEITIELFKQKLDESSVKTHRLNVWKKYWDIVKLQLNEEGKLGWNDYWLENIASAKQIISHNKKLEVKAHQIVDKENRFNGY